MTVVILTGPPGAGKSAVASRLARRHPRAVHLPTDDFWSVIVSGLIRPYEPAAHRQNEVVMDVIAGAAFTYAAGGYVTVVDGVIGPWMLDLFQAHLHSHIELHYVVLRPARDVALARAQGRIDDRALVDEQPIVHMWNQFADLGELEAHVLDTSGEDEATTERRVAAAIADGSMRLA